MLAIVLGSGLSNFSNSFENSKSESFESTLNTTYEVLDGHDRKFIWCSFEGEPFLVISGKFHFYEGHTFNEVIEPLRYAIEHFGINEMVITSASGGLSQTIVNGEWAHVKRVISIPEVNLGVPEMMKQRGQVVCISDTKSIFSTLPDVTYAYHQGPSLGTNAEYKMLDFLGANLVGMSMFPEYCFLKSLEIKSHFLSLPVCNYYPFVALVEPSFEEVIKLSTAAVPKLVDIFKQFLLNRKSK